MPSCLPALVTRTAVVATTTATVALVALLPATAAAATPPPAPASSPVSLAVPAALTAPAALTLPAAPAAARASALSNAMGKLGAPYRWGATGPNAFDCSGLVSWAFARAGVPLPRTSRAMSTVGTPVAKSDLRPGDLVLFYRPVSHVGIYIGDGKIVHASNRKSPVKVSDMRYMPFNSARRV